MDRTLVSVFKSEVMTRVLERVGLNQLACYTDPLHELKEAGEIPALSRNGQSPILRSRKFTKAYAV